MFLLIQAFTGLPALIAATFTFHNVSINTFKSFVYNATTTLFTFHNVSINTKARTLASYVQALKFTFHNVSINTGNPASVRVQRHIYIPQCFY